MDRVAICHVHGGEIHYLEKAFVIATSAITIPLFAKAFMRYGNGATIESPQWRSCCRRFDCCMGTLAGLGAGIAFGTLAYIKFDLYWNFS